MPKGIYKRKPLSEKHRRKVGIANKGKKYSDETKRKMSKAAKGKKHQPQQGFQKGHVAWNKGKRSSSSRDRDFLKRSVDYKDWHKAVFDRDNYTCQICGKRGCYLEAHHILPWAIYPEKRYDLNNGITLCLKHHTITKGGR